MTMLEDDLREMFGARVDNPPSAADPAGVAIGRGRKATLRRRSVAGTLATVAFVVMLGGAAIIKGIFEGPAPAEGDVTYEALYGERDENREYEGERLPIIDLPVDVHVGKQLWTTNGDQLTLTGVQEVIDIVRVPAGWIYSDDFRLRLLTVAGNMIPLRDDIAAWTVSHDGSTIASVSKALNLEVRPVNGGRGETAGVPTGTLPVDFDGSAVVLSHKRFGSDHWNAGRSAYRQAWHDQLVVVYGAQSDLAVGLLQQQDTTCLVDLRAKENGWDIGKTLGCGDLLDTAARARYDISRAARSPDGRWLAVPSATGVHVIDIHASRQAAVSGHLNGPVVAFSCMSRPDAPAVWADATKLLTIGTGNGVIACDTDGSRFAVQLPAGVSDGWELVRRFGVTG